MARIDLATVEPFEICSIRPPTENYSLTFRLTRNCGWNRCLFCPAYKYGAQFSRRALDDVKRDVDRAKIISDLLSESGIGTSPSAHTGYQQVATLIEEIKRSHMEGKEARYTAAVPDQDPSTLSGHPSQSPADSDDQEDQRVAWFASWFKDEPAIEDAVYHVLNWQSGGGETCFLGDSIPSCYPPTSLQER